MQEALVLFDSICNSRWFVRTSIILFLNKIDLFRQKIPLSPIANFFPDYTGGSDLQAACDYFSSRFVGLNQSSAKQIYVHITSVAIETCPSFGTDSSASPSQLCYGYVASQIRSECGQRYRCVVFVESTFSFADNRSHSQ